MAKTLKQYSPALQLVLIVSFFIAFLLLLGLLSTILAPLLTGYSLTALQSADVSIPNVSLTWKVLTIMGPVFMYLLPALLFARLITPLSMEWLNLNKPIRLWPAIFVIVVIVLGIPMSGLLYDWNCTWSMAQSSIQVAENTAALITAIMKMPNVVYLIINLLLFALIPAIARECFFRGVLQQVLIHMMPKAPWIAIIITSVIFSASYTQWQWFAPMILIGIQLSAIYYLTENLWLCILGDFIFSSVNWVQSYFNQLGWSNEDPLHPSATPWYIALISLILTVGLLWYFRTRIPKPVIKIAYQEDIESIGK
jgi:membrane protease YdiL (CAAX protease family)